MSWFQHFVRVHGVLRYSGKFPAVANIREASALVIRCHIKAEIIGRWLYCFTTQLIGCQLELAGFWYSVKHCAYIYSGGPRYGIADSESLDDIRSRLGSEKVTGGIYV